MYRVCVKYPLMALLLFVLPHVSLAIEETEVEEVLEIEYVIEVNENVEQEEEDNEVSNKTTNYFTYNAITGNAAFITSAYHRLFILYQRLLLHF